MESADPEAKMFLLVAFNDKERTESVCDPYFHFFALLENFLGFAHKESGTMSGKNINGTKD